MANKCMFQGTFYDDVKCEWHLFTKNKFTIEYKIHSQSTLCDVWIEYYSKLDIFHCTLENIVEIKWHLILRMAQSHLVTV